MTSAQCSFTHLHLTRRAYVKRSYLVLKKDMSLIIGWAGSVIRQPRPSWQRVHPPHHHPPSPAPGAHRQPRPSLPCRRRLTLRRHFLCGCRRYLLPTREMVRICRGWEAEIEAQVRCVWMFVFGNKVSNITTIFKLCKLNLVYLRLGSKLYKSFRRPWTIEQNLQTEQINKQHLKTKTLNQLVNSKYQVQNLS